MCAHINVHKDLCTCSCANEIVRDEEYKDVCTCWCANEIVMDE